jgi:hypothetical protein
MMQPVPPAKNKYAEEEGKNENHKNYAPTRMSLYGGSRAG